MIYVLPQWNTGTPTIPDFNAAVKQVQLFDEQSPEEVKIISLNFAPQITADLAARNLDHIDVISFFESIQRSELVNDQNPHFEDFNWPKNIKVVTTDIAYFVYKDGHELYAKAYIDRNEKAYISAVDIFKNDKISIHYDLDERGFIGRAATYDNEGQTIIKEEFYAPDGQLRMSHEFNADGSDNVLHIVEGYLGSKDYETMSSMQTKFLNQLAKKMNPEDKIILEYSKANHELVKNAQIIQPVYLSIPNVDQFDAEDGMTELYKHFVVMSERQMELLKQKAPQIAEHATIIPAMTTSFTTYDLSTTDTGQNVVWVDSKDQDDREIIIKQLDSALKKNPEMVLHVYNSENFTEDDLNKFSEPNRERVQKIDPKIPELELDERFKSFRVTVDLGKYPDQYVQTHALTISIPQIVSNPTEYNKEEISTTIITSSQVEKTITYFLDNLSNWGAGRQTTMFAAEEFYSTKMIDRWNKLFQEGGN